MCLECVHGKGLQIWFWPGPFSWEFYGEKCVEVRCADGSGQAGAHKSERVKKANK